MGILAQSPGAAVPGKTAAESLSAPPPASFAATSAARAPQELVLRDYQEHDIAEIRQCFRDGYRRVLLVQPCGAGKGTAAAWMIRGATERGLAVHFWVSRRTLVHDMSERLDRLQLDHGVIMAGHRRRRPDLRVHICSVDSLRKRATLPPADLIFIDEAHLSVTDSQMELMGRYPDARFVLMTATPCRSDNKGLRAIADVMVPGPSVQSLIDQGFLVPSRIFAPNPPDEAAVRKTEFTAKGLAELLDKPKLVGDIVRTWLAMARDRKSVYFAADKKHAEHLAEDFRAAGIVAVSVNDKTSDDDRKKIWDDLDYGGLRVLTAVGVPSYGWDHPIVSFVGEATATDSLSKYLQWLGRGARPFAGKRDLLIADHCGNVGRMEALHGPGQGFYETERSWSLESGLVKTKRKDDDAPGVRICRKCFFTLRAGCMSCPECGTPVVVKSRKIEVIDGSLEEVRREVKMQRQAELLAMPLEDRHSKWLDYCAEAMRKGWSPRAPIGRYRGVFGEAPPGAWIAKYFEKRKVTA